MTESKSVIEDNEITNNELLRSALDDKVEDIIWKIRSGYIVILYGALTLIIGKEGVFTTIANRSYSLSLFFLISGLSSSVFLIDFGYVRKRLKIIAARDRLVNLALSKKIIDDDLKGLLCMAGEAIPSSFDENIRKDYEEKRKWNLIWLLLPIYATTPLLALILYLLCH
jgi:hypothetical protein